jgi:hypothetical protein
MHQSIADDMSQREIQVEPRGASLVFTARVVKMIEQRSLQHSRIVGLLGVDGKHARFVIHGKRTLPEADVG